MVMRDSKTIETFLVEKEEKIRKLQAELEWWKQQVAIDDVTGVTSRKTGLRILEEELRSAEKGSKDLTICFLDVDNSKQVNDRLGHCEGDRLLSEVGKLIVEDIRQIDTIFRFGGDEFIFVFPNTQKEEARKMWDKIRYHIKKYNDKSGKYAIQISAGFAVYNASNPFTLLQLI